MEPASETLAHPELKEERVAFMAAAREALLYMRVPRERVLESGIRQTVEVGHPIQFRDYRYQADNRTKVQLQDGRRAMTEAEFLFDVSQRCEEVGGLQVWLESEWDPDGRLAERREAEQSSQSVLTMLANRTPAELRALFTQEEIDRNGLAKAAVPALAFHIVMLNKDIPSEWRLSDED